MKERRIIIVGVGSVADAVRQVLETDFEVKVVNNIEVKNDLRSRLEFAQPLPLVLTKSNEDSFESDIPRNKFIDKPKHNFRRR